jgi:hypothetical protein
MQCSLRIGRTSFAKSALRAGWAASVALKSAVAAIVKAMCGKVLAQAALVIGSSPEVGPYYNTSGSMRGWPLR